LAQGGMVNGCAGIRHGQPDSLPTSLHGAPPQNTILASTPIGELQG
jgi:hypothetical protein